MNKILVQYQTRWYYIPRDIAKKRYNKKVREKYLLPTLFDNVS